jgi:molecular chaperone GrpE (heat shock protein)
MSLLPTLDKLNDIYTKHHLDKDSTYNDILTNIKYLRTNLHETLSNDL